MFEGQFNFCSLDVLLYHYDLLEPLSDLHLVHSIWALWGLVRGQRVLRLATKSLLETDRRTRLGLAKRRCSLMVHWLVQVTLLADRNLRFLTLSGAYTHRASTVRFVKGGLLR